MALFAVVRHPDDLEACLRVAANHDGDSDSVASIAGGIIGGLQAPVPDAWKERLNRIQRVRLESVIDAVGNVLA